VLLQQFGCDLVQGYYLGHPAAGEIITQMLEQPCLLALPEK
jgi:EAL domain-containing protein (putative c-di-GMP-specific phosphodiesterase class I)